MQHEMKYNKYSTWVPWNLNYDVAVKLNDRGKELYAKHWEHYCKSTGNPVPTVEADEDGYTTFHMWELMNIFGNEMRMGARPPFIDLNVYVDIKGSFK